MLKWFTDLFKKAPPEISERERSLLQEMKENRMLAETMSRQLQSSEEELFSARSNNQKLQKQMDAAKKELGLLKSVEAAENISISDMTFIRKYLDINGNIQKKELKPYKDMKTDLNIKFTRNSNALPPTKFIKGDAGYDLFVPVGQSLEIHGHQRAIIDTGIRVDIPEGYYGKIVSRTSVALRQGITVMNEVIDSNYGETIKLIVCNVSNAEAVTLRAGCRIASLIIEKSYTVNWEQAGELPASDKMVLGSTGE